MLEVNILGSEPSVTTPCLTWIAFVLKLYLSRNFNFPIVTAGFYCPSPL